MTFISLICFLALASSAFGRSTYGSMSYGELPRSINLPLQKVDLQLSSQTPATFPVQSTFVSQGNGYSSNNYGQQMQKPSQGLFLDQISTVPQLTEADIRCQGQRADTVIPLDDGRRYIVCREDGKGVEQSCPRDLHFHTETQRCERRLGPLDNACVSNPCLHDGQCFPVDTSSYQCKCAPGYDGINCELDARICQTQQPCGQAAGTRCQSFRANAALQYICLHSNDRAYGFSAQQMTPSPCQNIDGAQPLSITEKGFIMCDGERMFIESCPGGTIWDDLTKACVWPDMQGFATTVRVNEQSKLTEYGQQKPLLTSSTDFQVQSQRSNLESNLIPSVQTSNYGSSSKVFQRSQDMIATPSSSYSSQQWTQKPQEFLQQPIQQSQDLLQQQIQKPQEFFQVQQPIQKPQEFFQQQTIQKPQESMQQWTQKPQEFLQQTVQKPQEFFQVQQQIQKPQEFFQQTVQKPQEFVQIQKPQEFLQVQQPVQKMQDFLQTPTQSYGGQQQQSFQRIQKQPEFRSFQATSSY